MGRREGVDGYFRKQLRQERERRGWSQADVAKKLSDQGIPMYATTVAKIEAGERGVRIDEAAGIADLLQVPLDWLLGRQAASPGSEIRYALRALQTTARTMVVDVAHMAIALQDWESDTFELSFDGKDEFDAACKDASDALGEAQSRVARIAGFQLPEDEPVWRRDMDKLHRLVRVLEAEMTPLEPITPESLRAHAAAKEAIDEAES